MPNFLHYAGDKIALPDATDVYELEQKITAAAVDGVHWFSISDASNNNHRIRTHPSIPIRLSTEPEPAPHFSYGL